MLIANGYSGLSESLQAKGKSSDAEESRRKSIEWLEKAIALGPDRPLLQHRLELWRERMDQLAEVRYQAHIEKLWSAKQFAEVHDAMLKGVKEQEHRVNSNQDRVRATKLLADRLDRLAYFLAHSPS